MPYGLGPREDLEKAKLPEVRLPNEKLEESLELVKATLAMQALAGFASSLATGAETVHTPLVPKEKAMAKAMDFLS